MESWSLPTLLQDSLEFWIFLVFICLFIYLFIFIRIISFSPATCNLKITPSACERKRTASRRSKSSTLFKMWHFSQNEVITRRFKKRNWVAFMIGVSMRRCKYDVTRQLMCNSVHIFHCRLIFVNTVMTSGFWVFLASYYQATSLASHGSKFSCNAFH